MDDNPCLRGSNAIQTPLTTSCGQSEGYVDLRVRLSVEGHRPLGLTVLDLLTGKRETL